MVPISALLRPRGAALAIAMATCMAQAALAADVRVDWRNETGGEDGSAARPYNTLGEAIAAAQAGDRVLVAAGTYQGPFRIEGKALQVVGGYTGATPLQYAAGGPGDFSVSVPTVNTTVLEGTPGNAVVTLVESGASRVQGFAIRNGGGQPVDEYSIRGGGIAIDGGSPTIADNLIEDNDARDPELPSFGGGIHTNNSDVTIERNTIRSNRAGRGAGISISGGTVVIRNNSIEGNVGTDDHGGGIYAFSQDLLIEGNRIFGNEIGRDLGYGWGGGIIVFNPGASAVLRDNLVYGNYAPTRGAGVFIDEGATALMEHCFIYNNESQPDVGAGAVYVDYGPDNIGSTLTMRHCTISGNLTAEPTLGGNALFVSEYSAATVENCIMWGNDGFSAYAVAPGTITMRYSTAEEQHPGAGNLTGDPFFADAASGDFHLRSRAGRWNPATNGWVLDTVNSPAIDAADPASPYDQEPQGNGNRANQGGHGNTAQASRTTVPTQVHTGFVVW